MCVKAPRKLGYTWQVGPLPNSLQFGLFKNLITYHLDKFDLIH